LSRIYNESLKENGRRREDVEILANRVFYVADETNQALEEARPHVKRLAQSYLPRGLEKVGAFIPFTAKKDLQQYDLDLEKFHEDRYIIGDLDECISQLENYSKEAGVEHFVLRLKLPGMKDERVTRAIEMIGKKIIPYFK
jgi:alkanesulfonate monooxygenase SsuD/methylene tetrahydromethanopterin reductase-like flavin-dependent oxidoreductase (luciferase family)